MRRYGLAIALLAGAVLAVGGAWRWREHRRMERIVTAVPTVPDLRGKAAKLGQALAAAETLVRTSGRALEGVAELGRIYHANDYRAQAEVCWRLLHQQQPQEARWAYYLADLRRTASDYEEMAALLGETVAEAPDYAPAWLQLAEQAFKTGDAVTAERGYRRRLELVPGDPYARLGLARLAWQDGRREEARREIEAIVREVPQFPSSHNLYAEMLAAAGDEVGAARERQLAKDAGRFREADDPWLRELQAWCYDPKRLFMFGTVDYQLGRGDRGLSYFERAVELVPDDPAGYEMLGDLCLKLGQPARAREQFERSLALAADLHPPPALYVLLSQSCRDLHQPEEALKAAERGLARYPDTPELHNAKGAALADLRRHEEAVVSYRKAVALNANDPDTNFNLAASLLALGQGEEAVARLKRSLMLRPRFPQPLALLGRIEMDSGRMEEARHYFQLLIEGNPDQPQGRQLMALWHLQAGRTAESKRAADEAERQYRTGLELAPEQPELNASLGALYLVQGRFTDALKPLEALQRVRPEDPQTALFLGQTYAALGQREEAKRILTRGVMLAEKAGRKETAAYCREILQGL